MDKNKPSREEDAKVVMSKLTREEFVNLQKICEMENKKSINKKLKELIQKEIAEVLFRKDPLKVGSSKKFFIPSENRFVEMFEVKE